MRQNSKYFENINYINFTPLKLKVNKTEFFSIPTNQDNNKRHKSSSCLNNKVKNHPLIRNPTHNFLYDKININFLSNSKFLLNKTILKENQSFFTNKNSKSVDCAIKKFRKKEDIKNIYKIGNSIKLDNNDISNFYDKAKKPAKTLYIYTDLDAQNKYNQKNRLSNYNYNSNPVPIYTEPKNYNHEDKIKSIIINRKGNIKKYNKLDKIILIQSYWRSYYLRKLVVGGLEKYYSSIAMSKYLNNVLYQNKKYLFHYFIELIKEYIITNKFSYFKYKRNKNNINNFFKNKDDDTNGSFEIPLDKKNDCIYFFIKREQAKSNKNKPYDNSNNDTNLFNDDKDIKINGYNWKSNKKSRNIKNNKLNCLNNENCKKVNIKINSINLYDLENNKKIKRFESDIAINGNKKRQKIKSIDLYINPSIKASHKKIYTKKRIGEEKSNKNNNRNIFLKRFKPSFVNQVSDSNIIKNRIKKNKKEINANKLNSVVKIIKKKYFHFYYPIFIKKLKIENSKKTRNGFQLHLFPKRNITYYKKKGGGFDYAKLKLKSDNKNEINKIKVNKNNNIEKLKKYKLIKKIMEKKINKINKKNIIYLTKCFLFWKNFFKIKFSHFQLKEKLKSNNEQQTDLCRYKSEHTSPKKHIKFRFKKLFHTVETICSSNSERKKNSSMSCKKMKIFKKYSDQKNLFSTFSTVINSNCKKNLFTQINKKHDFYDKIVSLMKKLENKNMKNKYFTYWKKKK